MKEMESSGIAGRIRAEEGNLRYEYFLPSDDPQTVLLIDSWKNQEALDRHHATEMMQQIVLLREKYDLHMRVERYVSAEENSGDEKYARK
ncbi:MAG: antibiotic biosynthesis monooxygenase [Erysipelotrichaceae bacterium]|nr:antibiotic biosynthesis monooxygenase [Erysipelotrichaceae bacterium]MBR5048228.1 antibiotic biosynthesis monooxygenase [Erysipelotrichaceae bacterium]